MASLPTQPSNSSQSRVGSMTPGACDPCRKGKVKCELAPGVDECLTCARKGIQCVFARDAIEKLSGKAYLPTEDLQALAEVAAAHGSQPAQQPQAGRRKDANIPGPPQKARVRRAQAGAPYTSRDKGKGKAKEATSPLTTESTLASTSRQDSFASDATDAPPPPPLTIRLPARNRLPPKPKNPSPLSNEITPEGPNVKANELDDLIEDVRQEALQQLKLDAVDLASFTVLAEDRARELEAQRGLSLLFQAAFVIEHGDDCGWLADGKVSPVDARPLQNLNLNIDASLSAATKVAA